MADASPKFALHVSSVEGRLVSRPGSPHSYIGARVPNAEERKEGAVGPSWSPEVVVPILASEYLKFVREYDKLLRHGDLAKRSEADFAAYQKALEAKEAARDAELKKAESAAKQPAKSATQGDA